MKEVEKQDLKYIESIEIKGLWGRYDVDWKLNPDVNILVGENGTGKSTVLKALERVKNVINDSKNTSLHVEFDNDIYISTLKISINIKKENTYIYLNQGRFFNHKQSVSVGLQDINSLPKIDYIRTFDNILNISDIDRKFNPELETELDFYIKKAIELYKDFQIDLSKKIINQKQNPDKVFSKKKYFIDTINRLVSKTGKVLDEDENGIIFLLDGKPIKTYELSSGEKQLLLILLTVLNQDEKPSILLMDEPEISLHLRWQYELIEILRTLNPNCQLIIATHSPSIFGKGWRDKVKFIDEIIPQLKKIEV